jgi:hypothetical protein
MDFEVGKVLSWIRLGISEEEYMNIFKVLSSLPKGKVVLSMRVEEKCKERWREQKSLLTVLAGVR